MNKVKNVIILKNKKNIFILMLEIQSTKMKVQGNMYVKSSVYRCSVVLDKKLKIGGLKLLIINLS